MGVFLGILGVFLVAGAGVMMLTLILGEWGVLVGAVLLAAALVKAGLNAYWSLCDRLEQIEKKLDALLEQRKRSDAE